VRYLNLDLSAIYVKVNSQWDSQARISVYLNRVIISQCKKMIRSQIVSEFYCICLWFDIWYKNIDGGRLVGHPYITSLWLGFPICEALTPKRVLHCSLALFCLLPGYYKLWISVNKGVQGSLCYLHPHFCVLKGVIAIQGIFVLYFMDPIQIIANIYLQSKLR